MGVTGFHGGYGRPVRARTFGGGEFMSPVDGGKFPGRPRFHSAAVAGGAAGNITVTGITTDDDLVSVVRHIGAGVAVTDVTDVTSEFTITATNTINNGGGTNTTGSKLAVTYARRGNYDSGGLTFPSGETTKAIVYLEAPIEWATPKVHAVILGESYGSGTVRLDCGGAGDVVEVAVAAAYIGLLNFPTGPTWSGGSGAFSHLQLAQFPLLRIGGHANDTLEEGMTVVKLTAAQA